MIHDKHTVIEYKNKLLPIIEHFISKLNSLSSKGLPINNLNGPQ